MIPLLTLWLAAGLPLEDELPAEVTAIGDLDGVERLRHHEVLQVIRDFGRPEVNIAIDAWLPAESTARIEGVRVWWSDPVDRFPFNDLALRHVGIDYQQRAAGRWDVRVAGDGRAFDFSVTLHEGRAVALVDVEVADHSVVRGCRVTSAQLQARRVLGIPIGLGKMIIGCIDADGHRRRGVMIEG